MRFLTASMSRPPITVPHSPQTPVRASASVCLPHEIPAFQRRLVVVLTLVRSFGELHFLSRHLLVGDETEKVCDTVQPGTPLVVRANDEPRCILRIGRFQHQVARPGVSIPP